MVSLTGLRGRLFVLVRSDGPDESAGRGCSRLGGRVSGPASLVGCIDAAVNDEPAPREADRFDRQQRVMRIATLTLLASLVFLGGAVVERYVFDEPPRALWDPLAVYPEQIVTSVQPVHVGDVVSIAGVKCVKRNIHEPVRVAGSLGWQLVEPRDGTYGESRGQSLRYPAGLRPKLPVPSPGADGCTSFRFENPMPAEVVKVSRQLLVGRVEVVWRVIGHETPIARDGTRGESREFASGPIRVIW